MKYRKYLDEAFNVNFDANKSARSPKEWDDFVAYEEKLFRLKKLAFEAGYDLAIRWTASDNPKNGFFVSSKFVYGFANAPLYPFT